jgi:hypothetical protein
MSRMSGVLVLVALAGCLSKDEKLALFDDDADGSYTEFAVDWGGEPPWDCDDTRADVHPGASELCDGVDNDCDDETDEGVEITIYGDADKDGYGVQAVSDLACEAPTGWAELADDCADDDATVNPGAVDECNGVDDNCDGAIDDGGTVMDVFPDGDGDGYGDDVAAQTDCEVGAGWSDNNLDCNDSDDAVHPDAADAWYDGIDSNCDAADDLDADGDGHRDDGHGGDDCDDGDELTYLGAAETWADLPFDRDCDGSLVDQVILDLDNDAVRLDGEATKAQFGEALAVLPAGWGDDEAVLLVGSDNYDNYRGRVYGFTRSDLVIASAPTDATFVLTAPDNGTTPFGMGLGFAFGRAGSPSAPITVISAASYDFSAGRLYGWHGSPAGGTAAAAFTIDADRAGIGLGGTVLEDRDLDGDGVDDLVTSAIVDNRVVSNAGSVGVFFVPETLTGAVSYADADLILTHSVAGARIKPVSPGDTNDDGTDDLFVVADGASSGMTAWVIVEPEPRGMVDVTSASSAQFDGVGGPMRTTDSNVDGIPELVAFAGSARRFALPVAGVVTWDDALDGEMGFGLAGDWITSSDGGQWIARANLASSWVHTGETGAVAITSWFADADADLDSATYVVLGENPGDRLGAAHVRMLVDGDATEDLIIGAPRTDHAGADAGSVYVISGPH